MDVLLVRFEAPMISFGAPIIDNRGVIQPYPAMSMMTGLLGNALGYDHADFALLESLQSRLKYASRQDRRGQKIEDYQTVNLGKPYMDDARAWTTRDELEERAGGSASSGTHIRRRDYWADAAHTVAITLSRSDDASAPTVETLESALREPERPLFVGRKTCLPAEPMALGTIRASGLVDALRVAPLAREADGIDEGNERFRAWWPSTKDGDGAEPDADMREPVTDRRDWENQIHVGQRWIATGDITVDPNPDAFRTRPGGSA